SSDLHLVLHLPRVPLCVLAGRAVRLDPHEPVGQDTPACGQDTLGLLDLPHGLHVPIPLSRASAAPGTPALGGPGREPVPPAPVRIPDEMGGVKCPDAALSGPPNPLSCSRNRRRRGP